MIQASLKHVVLSSTGPRAAAPAHGQEEGQVGRSTGARRAGARFRALASLITLLTVPRPTAAQSNAPSAHDAPPTIKSMGQPPLIKPFVGGTLTWSRDGQNRVGGIGIAGLYKDLMLPLSGAFGFSVEGYAGGSGGNWDRGARLFAASRLLSLNLGVDLNADRRSADLILSWTPHINRGGLFRSGGHFRIDWIPGRGHSLHFGYQVPLEAHMGKTRPASTKARLPDAPRRRQPPTRFSSELQPVLEELRSAAEWSFLNTNAFNDEAGRTDALAMGKFRVELARIRALFQQTNAQHPQGRTHAIEIRHYHEALERAFALAARSASGAELADRAREILLDEVLLPYDRLIGQFKKPDTLRGLNARARERFALELAAREGLDPERREALLAIFEWLTGVIEDGRRRLSAHWEGDQRDVWLPLDLALHPDQHDSQAELDALVERAVGRPFTRGNLIYPTNASRFQIELLRSLQAAEDYHVLWVHDFAGRVEGKPDPVAHETTVKGYLRALTEGVRAYDRTGRMPIFMIFHTHYFYEGSKSRLFLSLLEDPLGHELHLGPGFEDMERQVRIAQDELRRAVAASQRLQAEARQRGKGWLRSVARVHVSVTFRADLSFRTKQLMRVFALEPDSIMLDHRKLFFYDVTEEDPRRGAALFTGTGVGSEYAGPTWDDRGLLVSGPSLVELKNSAHRLLLSQGWREADLPAPLRPRPRPPVYDALVRELVAAGHTARGLNVHNEVGFGTKEATLTQALLYTLAPPDTIIISPDSIWTSPFWAGQLVGAALRGCHVYVIAPSAGNAPAPGSVVLARTREIIARLFEARKGLAEPIAAAGGHLRVGLYTRSAPSGDTLAKIREAAAGLRRYPFLGEEFPLPRGSAELFEEEATALEASGYKPHFLAEGTRAGRPKMHRKTQLFAGRRALQALTQAAWARDELRLQVTARAEATRDPDGLRDGQGPLREGIALVQRIERLPPEDSRDALYYFSAGSKNQDPRGAALDGETTYLVAGPWSFYLYSDFLLLMAATTWIDDERQIAELIPWGKEKARKLGRLVRKLI